MNQSVFRVIPTQLEIVESIRYELQVYDFINVYKGDGHKKELLVCMFPT